MQQEESGQINTGPCRRQSRFGQYPRSILNVGKVATYALSGARTLISSTSKQMTCAFPDCNNGAKGYPSSLNSSIDEAIRYRLLAHYDHRLTSNIHARQDEFQEQSDKYSAGLNRQQHSETQSWKAEPRHFDRCKWWSWCRPNPGNGAAQLAPQL